MLDFESCFREGARMSEIKWEVVYEMNGSFLAEILRGLLEAQEIPVVLSQEGAGRVYGLTVGTLGRVQILVPAPDLERAQHILVEYETGNTTDLGMIDGEMPSEQDLESGDHPGEDEQP
jgi:hypothetical protein